MAEFIKLKLKESFDLYLVIELLFFEYLSCGIKVYVNVLKISRSTLKFSTVTRNN